MKKVCKSKDGWGQLVIYVETCDKFKKEPQIDPFDKHNIINYRIYDIIVNGKVDGIIHREK